MIGQMVFSGGDHPDKLKGTPFWVLSPAACSGRGRGNWGFGFRFEVWSFTGRTEEEELSHFAPFFVCGVMTPTTDCGAWTVMSLGTALAVLRQSE